MPDAFNPRTDRMFHFIHDVLYGTGGLQDMIRYEVPFPKCVERHDAASELGLWACDAAEWVLDAATRSPEIMAALNQRAADRDTFRDDGATTPEGCEDERQGEVPGA